MQDYTNSEMAELINDHIHNVKHREILKDRLINGLTYEVLAEMYEMSVTQIKRIVYKGQDNVFRHMNLF